MTSFSTAGAGVKAPTAIPDSYGYLTDAIYRNGTARAMSGSSLYNYTAINTTETIFSITGSGIIQFGMYGANVADTGAVLKVNIDGVEVYSNTGNNLQTTLPMFAGCLYLDRGYTIITTSLSQIPYNSSFSVSMNSTTIGTLLLRYYET